MTFPSLDILSMDFKQFGESDILGVLNDLEFPTPPLSPDQDIKDAGLDGSAPLLPEIPASLPTDASNLDIVSVFQIPMSEADIFDKDSSLYDSPNLEIANPILPLGSDDPKAVLQDCMWGSVLYEPRNIGSASSSPEMYTPAPSPLGEISGAVEAAEESCSDDFSSEPNNHEEKEILSTPQMLTYSEAVEVDSKCVQKEELQQREHEARLNRKKEREERRSSNGNKRQALMSYNGRRSASTDSGSDDDVDVEEIDVVTVSDKPAAARLNPRKKLSPVTLSAPCSRQSSPTAGVLTTFKLQPMKQQQQQQRRRTYTKRAHRLSSAGSTGDGLESDEEQKRTSHNILERKRRNDLKKSYQALRNNIPELEENQRAPKVTILRKATELITEMTKRNETLNRKYDQEKRREMQLLQRLALLKSAC